MLETTEIEKRATQPKLPAPLAPLERLAWNYWWSWAADGAGIFRDLDPEVWEECEQNPRELLAKTSAYRLAEAATDPVYLERVRRLDQSFQSYMESGTGWTISDLKITKERPVAYFCAEFGVHNSLPLYSGGLGILAGDHLKSASDLRLPLVAIGLMYRYGYFRQRLRNDGWQEEHYGETFPNELPITLIKEADGTPMRIEVSIRERNVLAQVWRADVGTVQLYLLDTNIPENVETDRWVTGHLYGGDRETRIVQEMLLGIGGVRLLRKLGVTPYVHHLNEGHSAFLTLELAREVIQQQQVKMVDAIPIVRQQCVFTTHTPVAAGNDEFDASLVMSAFGSEYAKELGLSEEEFLALGRVDAANKTERYGLTPLAIRMCRSTNGVSLKHGEVSRALWQKLFPEKKVEDVPISYVTNGVHAPTWVAPLLRYLFEKYIGQDWEKTLRDSSAWTDAVTRISDEELWIAHSMLKERLIAFVRHRTTQSRLAAGEKADYIEAAKTMFDSDALTIGFARRVAGYKRWNLLLSDQQRLLRLINNEERPVQFVFAGKAHPQDEGSKLVLQQLALWKYDKAVRHRAVFLEDYDQEIARQLVQSVDVWLNVPRRPLEASGTSGEKVAMNGGLNLSILDGWWLEGYDGTNGFAIGSGFGSASGTESSSTAASSEVAAIDAADAESLYRTLEQEVVPLFYTRDKSGLPRQWIAMMKRAIQTLAPKYNSNRMVEDYISSIYQ
ncbi:MAG TPA: alpha-glucan family phosphorylase [Pyrinomonadaceae bacterium]|nr:alpha-glucan family phosphorylase [Pyrinomonadaceae bacterium]